MQEKFMARLRQALAIKCKSLNRLTGQRILRIRRDYDSNFVIAVRLNDKAGFVITDTQILVDNVDFQRYSFMYNRITENLDELSKESQDIDLTLEFLSNADAYEKMTEDILSTIEKRLDVLDSILSDATVEAPAQDIPSSIMNTLTEISEDMEEQEQTEPDDTEDNIEDDIEDIEVQEEWQGDIDNSDTPEEIDEVEKEPERINSEEEMGKSIVKNASNPWDAMRVLKSLGYKYDDFIKFGVPEDAVNEYRAINEKDTAD